MDTVNQIVKEVKFDEEKRILVSIQNQFEVYLQDQKIRSMLKESAQSILQKDFVQLEIAKNICRITVSKGSEETSLELVKTELVKGLQMAMAFLSHMQNQK